VVAGADASVEAAPVDCNDLSDLDATDDIAESESWHKQTVDAGERRAVESQDGLVAAGRKGWSTGSGSLGVDSLQEDQVQQEEQTEADYEPDCSMRDCVSHRNRSWRTGSHVQASRAGQAGQRQALQEQLAKTIETASVADTGHFATSTVSIPVHHHHHRLQMLEAAERSGRRAGARQRSQAVGKKD